MEREETEMQMEQLALDCEILKQENHDLSKKLEQIQLREQLRMQFDCSAHLASISELESQVENLQNEIKRLTEAFKADLEFISRVKIEEEKRAIPAEEALRKTRSYNCNTAEKIQVEFRRLAAQMSSAFYMNEKLVMDTLKESSELQLQKCQLEDALGKTKKELYSVRNEHNVKSQQQLILIDFRTKEVINLSLELKKKCKELENQSIAEGRRIASSEHIAQLISLHEKSLLPENGSRSNGDYVRTPIMEDKKRLKDLNSIGTALIISNSVDSPETEEERSILCCCDQQKTIELLLEMEELKKQNQLMETNLKKLQQRFSELSSNFTAVVLLCGY